MADPTRYPVVLTDDLPDLLNRLHNSRTAPARLRRNATILLARAAGQSLSACAGAAGCCRQTVVSVCRRFAAGGWELVCREAPRGQPFGHRAADRAEVLAWAQCDPQALGLPVTRWSLFWLRVLWQRRKATPPPSRETLRRWLRLAAVCWFALHTFCRSTDPAYAAKRELVCDAYLCAPADWAVLCYDQKPHLQALSRAWPTRFPRPGSPGQYPHDYQRHGTTCLHALLNVRTGTCCWAARPDHKAVTIAALLGPWVRACPQRKVILILDNLSANLARAVQQALTATGKLVLVFPIPTYSSWLNQVERVFADLQRDLLDHARAASVADLERQLRAWFTQRNATARPYHWTYHPGLRLCETGH